MTGHSEDEDARLMTGAEVVQLLNIGKSTLQAWRESGALEAIQLPMGGWRYPSNQPTIANALAALGRAGRAVYVP
jgi:predicted site-specific integrase-resolvase